MINEIQKDIEEKVCTKEGNEHTLPCDNTISQTIRDKAAHFEEEILVGFSAIQKYNKTITFFGSARFDENNRYYKKAEEIAGALCKEGYTIVTGGGGGIMEAGNRGSKETCNSSVGFNIELPQEQTVNPYVTDSVTFHFFASRKMSMYFSGEAFLFFPGGYGTLDEFFQILTLIQTHKTNPVPVICIGSDYWEPIKTLARDILFNKVETIAEKDIDLFKITDDTDELINIIKTAKSE